MSHENVVLGEFEVLGRTVQIVHGDITIEDVDAIVNAANSHLQHGGGVAGAIVRRGGYIIQEESDDLVRKNGPVPVGEAVVTSGGKLKAKYVIHAVGPVWRGTGDEEALLHRAVYNSLLRAHELGVATLSMPAISTGIFGFPKERAAGIFKNAIEDFFREHGETELKIVRLCNIDEKTCKIFLREFSGSDA